MSPLDHPLLQWLLRTSGEASVLIAVVLGVRWAFPRLLSPRWCVALWVIVGVKLLVPAALPLGFGLGEWFAERSSPAALTGEEPQVALLTASRIAATDGAAQAARGLSAKEIVLLLWASGVAGVIGLVLTREVRFRRALRTLPACEDAILLGLTRACALAAGLDRMLQVRMLPAGSGPAITGMRAPVLLLPSDWRERFDEAALQHVVLHELEHVRGHDLVWNWVATALVALHWFNPLAWIASARFQADRELRCDAGALARLAPGERVAYGRTLLQIAESFSAPPATAGLAPCVRRHPTLQHRLHMIIRPPSTSPALQAFSAAVLGALVCFSFGSARAQEAPGKERSPEARAPREGDRERPREGEKMRDGDQPRTGARDGDAPRTGARDGEQRRSGARDGDRPRSGARDGDQPRTGPRDEGGPKPEGERSRRMESRESGEGRPSREGSRRESRETDPEQGGTPIEVRVLGEGGEVNVAGEVVPTNRLRGFLQEYLRENRGRPVFIDADASTPYSAVAGVLDAVRDNGAKNAQIRSQSQR